MLRTLALCALLAAPLGAAPAAANDVRTAGQLADYCAGDLSSDEGAVARVFCYGYLTGVMQLHREMVNDLGIESAACPDYAVSRETLADVYVRYVAANPERRGGLPIDVLGEAAAEAWPCR
jgi:hypothetical protein